MSERERVVGLLDYYAKVHPALMKSLKLAVLGGNFIKDGELYCGCGGRTYSGPHTCKNPPQSGTQRKIESIHNKLMDIRDATPMRRGSITAEQRYLRMYKKAYRASRLTDFYAAAERYRYFLQEAKHGS